MTEKLQLPKIKELSIIEIILIKKIYSIMNSMEFLEQLIIKHATTDYNKTVEYAKELQALKGCRILEEFKKDLWEYATLSTLNNIYNEEGFKEDYAWTDRIYRIDKRVLLDFSSYDKFNINDEKAQLAKKLGATITA